MQERNFDGFYVGSNTQSGLYMPNLQHIAYAYGFPYRSIDTNDEIGETVRWAMETQGACIVDIRGSLSFDEIPKCISRVDEQTGQRISADLENPFPFLSREELAETEAFLRDEAYSMTREDEAHGTV